jgi:GNAT superfamily N-acetyltransferase
VGAILRQATRADIPGMWRVRHAVTENVLPAGRIGDEEVRSQLEDTGRGWVIEVDGRVEAFAVGNGTNGNVWALFTHPEAQGRGFGSQLHNEMVQWFSSQPIPTLWLTTGATTIARAFYERRGWELRGPYGDKEVRYERRNAP